MADLEEHRSEIEAFDAQVVALSSDPLEGARGTVEKLDLHYTVLYGLDAEQTSEAIGCYTGEHDGEPHIQPAGFVLKRDGTIALAVYSSGKVGRLTADDALTALKDLEG